MADTTVQLSPIGPAPSRPLHLLQCVINDRLLIGSFGVCAVLLGYQLTVTLLQPPWIKPATDWLRTGLAWPQLLVVAWVAMRLRLTRQSGAVAWCFVALGMLSYAVARTLWTIDDAVLDPHGVPFPSLPDLFFILQYPCFFLALVFAPILALGGRLPSVRVLLDGLLWMSAITALTWYFVLMPISQRSGESSLAKQISMGYQVGDLVLVYGLVIALARPRPRSTRFVLSLFFLGLAAVSLFIADTWATLLLFHPHHTYRTGGVADLFWITCYLLIPLAALVRLRLTPAELPARPSGPMEHLTWRDVWAGVKFVAPSGAVLVAGMVIILTATLRSPGKGSMFMPEGVSFALLVLALVRPAVLFLEHEQVRRERDAARAQERSLQMANERMEAFLSMVAHELKTPLTSLVGYVHLMASRLDLLLRHDASHDAIQEAQHDEPDDCTRAATVQRRLVAYSAHSLQRMERLVDDVLDQTRVRQGRLAVRLEPCDLAAVVGEAVAEQRALNPERSIRCNAEASPVPVLADSNRIQQVVANMVSNALKFSRDDQVVDVCLCREREGARVAVRDEGIGIPLAEQPHIWEQFYQAPGAKVQSGSQVGVGLGLYISRAIIEGHRGQVGVQSAPGHGTTLWFSLPLASPLVAPLVATSSDAEAGSPAPAPGSGDHERDRAQRTQ